MQSRTPTLTDRAGAACGAAYVLLILVGNQMASGNQTDPHPSGATDLADFGASPTVAQTVGFTMEVTGMLALFFFLGWFVHQLRRSEGPAGWLAGVVGAAGVATLAIKIGSVAPILAGQADHDQLGTTLARVLADMNGSSFVATFLTTGVFLLAAGLALLASGYLGRVAGWTGVVIGVLALMAPLATNLDPVSTNPLPFLAGLLWILVVSVRLAWKGPRAAVEAPAPAAAAVPA